jgi:ERCC4-related helicase
MAAFMLPERSQRILLTEIDLDLVAAPGSAVRIIDEVVESLHTSEIET